MKLHSKLALTLAALSLIPTACTINSTTNEAAGGAGNTLGGAAGAPVNPAAGASATSGGAQAVAGAPGVAGQPVVAGASSVAGSPGAAGQSSAAGASSVAGQPSAAGQPGAGGQISAAGQPSVAGATSSAGTAGAGGAAPVAGSSSVLPGGGAAGASSVPTLTRVNVTDIDEPTTWTAGHVYVIAPQDNLYVSATLTIQAGAVVKFGADSRMTVVVGGQLNAIGTATAPIVFTGIKDDTAGGDTNGDGAASTPAIGDYNTVVVNANSSAFDYVDFRYSDTGLLLSGANQSVKNSTFTFNNLGLDINGVSNPSSTVVTGNTFYSNTHPMVIDGGIAIDATNTFHSPVTPTVVNKFQAIEVTTGIDNAVTWSNTEVAYALTRSGSSYYIGSPAVLTLAVGVVVKANASSAIIVENGASLVGAATATFTSYKDDTKLGDSNGDGAATAPAAADWDGVRVITTNSDSWLSGSNILYADSHS